jgi:hypothetical protein
MLPGSMFLRSNKRIKQGKEHRYYTGVESRRLKSGRVAQRQVLYLGEINGSQQAAWRKTLDVFDEEQHRFTPLSLFPEDLQVPADTHRQRASEAQRDEAGAGAAVGQLLVGGASYGGSCSWIGSGKSSCRRDGQASLGAGGGIASGEPTDGSGQRVSLAPAVVRSKRDGHFVGARSCGRGKGPAVPLSGSSVLEHKQELFVSLQQRWKDLFDAEFDVLLYDLTST